MKIAVVFVVMSGFVSGANWTSPFGVPGNESAEWRLNPVESIEPGALLAEDGEFEFLLYVYVDGKSCAGGLVKGNWVLCSANCVSANVLPTKVIAVGGRANLAVFEKRFQTMGYGTGRLGNKLGLMTSVAKNLVIHPNYSKETYEHDIALIELMEPIVGTAVDTIPLSYEKMSSPMPCTIFSWGTRESNKNPFQLRYWKSKIAGIPPDNCIAKRKKFVICITTDEAGVCLGDSGSPLVCKGKVWGVSSRSRRPCQVAPEDYFAELYPELEWMHSIINHSERRAASLRGVLAALTGAWLVSAALEIFDLFIFHYK